jgi:hypothetical protein
LVGSFPHKVNPPGKNGKTRRVAALAAGSGKPECDQGPVAEVAHF